MGYDKRSFTAGIAVGRQLKGWSVGGQGDEPTPPTLQEKEVWTGTSSLLTVTPDTGFDGLSQVIIHVGEHKETWVTTAADFARIQLEWSNNVRGSRAYTAYIGESVTLHDEYSSRAYHLTNTQLTVTNTANDGISSWPEHIYRGFVRNGGSVLYAPVTAKYHLLPTRAASGGYSGTFIESTVRVTQGTDLTTIFPCLHAAWTNGGSPGTFSCTFFFPQFEIIYS